MKKPAHIVNFLFAITIYVFLFPISFILYKRKKIWLFCERGNDANDNSYFLFKWLNENHPEINSIFVIQKKSRDLEKIKKIGKYVSYRSFKHWLIYISSNVRLSTHLYSCAPNKYLGAFFLKYKKKKGIDVFLQHGITHNYQDCFFRKNNLADINICAVKSEYDYLMENFDLGSKHLFLTGFPRYDSLINIESSEKFILLQPTWRSWLSGLTDEEFKETEYYKEWINLFQNTDLCNLLKQNNIILKFNLHPSVYKYRQLFVSDNNSIQIIKDNVNLQQLFNNASLLITDYSSILFDFAYLRKPTIYYQFDENKFYSMHYLHGYFNIKDNGFGEVCNDIDTLVARIKEYVKSSFEMKDVYLKRIDYFFTYNDQHNCDRVYEIIIRRINE